MRKATLLLGVLVVSVVVIAGCSGGGSSGGNNGPSTSNASAAPTVQIYPATPSLPPGTAQQFTATLVGTDGSKQDITSTATWTSSAPSIATVSDTAGSKGLVSALAVGTATITATTSGGIFGSATLKVPTLTSLAVSPSSATIPVGTSQPYTATGTFADNSTSDLTTQVTWSSSDSTVATVSNSAGTKGVARSVAVGSAVITATFGTVSANGGITVNGATLSSLAISPGPSTIAVGTTRRFQVTGTYSDNSSHDATTLATWSAAPTSVVTVGPPDANGRIPVTAVSPGTATITASFGGMTTSITVTVTSATIVALATETGTSLIGLGIENAHYTAIATFSDGSTQDVTDDTGWESSDGTVATIGTQIPVAGIATPLKVGTTTITATYSNVTAPAQTLKVTTPEPTVSQSSPTQGTIGQTVAIMGTNFVKGGTSVIVGGVAATQVTVSSSSYLQFAVPDTATGDNNLIVVHTGNLPDATSPETFSVTTPTGAPTITGVTPTLGPSGQRVVVNGTNFVKGGTSITLGGTDVGTVTVGSTQALTFIVPPGIANGSYGLTITTTVAPGSPATKAGAFTVGVPTGPPSIDSISPTYGPVGTYIVVTGHNFYFGQTTVIIGNEVAAPSAENFGGPESFTVAVPPGVSLIGKPITVQTPNPPAAQSPVNFTVTTH